MRLFIGNLPIDASVGRLRKILGEAANTARFRLFYRRHADGATQRFGYADLASEETAYSIAEQVNGIRIDGCELEVRPVRQRSILNDRRRHTATRRAGKERRKAERRKT